MIADRITLWGNSGSGKSTLAEQMSLKFGLPVFHLDKIAWAAGWAYADEPAFLEAHRDWIERPWWIIEGVGHMSGIRQRFDRAEVIVHLDTPLDVCRRRAQVRLDEDRLRPNRFMAEGCRYAEVVEKQREVIDYFDRCMRADIDRLIEAEFASKIHIRIDGSKSTDELLAEIQNA